MCIHDTVGALPDIHVWQLLLIEKDAKIFYTPFKVATTQMQIVLYEYQSLQYRLLFRYKYSAAIATYLLFVFFCLFAEVHLGCQ